MNTFIIEIDSELNIDILKLRIESDIIFDWLKIWRIKVEQK